MKMLPETVLLSFIRLVLRIIFRVRVRGLENFPGSGPRLVIANHTSWLDGAFLPESPFFAVDTRLHKPHHLFRHFVV
jgi:acyl-[acyl-carrier-protein]-phospholipid O-acyltransferase / long-chain-fatty-acid--[acyl-carrier-protein] ligase